MHNYGQPPRMRCMPPSWQRPKRVADMNVGNGGPPLPLSAAHLQQLAQMGINPNQLNQLAMNQQLMAAQPQTNGLPVGQQLPPAQSVAAAAAAAQQQAAVAAATAQQQQQHLHQQQQHQQQAAAAAAAVAHGHSHTPHGGVAVSGTPVVHIQPQQGAQMIAQLHQLQAAQNAHHAQAQQAQLAQQIQQAQMVNAVANPVCPPPPPGIPSMPWPVTSPVCHIPYFDMNMYRQVSIDVMPSHDPSGMDLPLTDIATLRFFFNFGVQQSRNLIAARSSQQQQSHQQPQQQHLASFQEAIAAAAASGQNPANLISLMTNASAAQNQTASLEQLNALLGQHSMLRQAQQLQGNPAQAHLQQNAAMQQQLNSILAANQNNQRQMPQQAYVQQQAAIQQQLSALMQQMPQNQQMAAAAAAAAAAAPANERKITQSDLMAHAAAAQPPIGIAAGAQQLPVAQMQQAVTPVQPTIQQAPAPQQPQATQAQTLQKHFDSHTLLLQHALLAASNNQSKQPSLHEIRLQAMAQQQATSSSTSPATGLHPFIRPTETLNNKQATSTTPTTGVLVSNSNGETTITISPRPPIPLDPSPPHVVVHVSKHELSAFSEKQVTEAQASSTTDEDAKPSTSTTVSTPTSVGAPTLSVSAATTSAAMPIINPIGIANPMAVSSSALARTTVSTPANTTSSPASSLAAGTAVPAGTIPPLIQISEDHFTDTFRKSEQKRQLGHLNPNAGQAGSPKTNGEQITEEDGEDKPALAPILMMSYLNTCMSQAKTQLNANGVNVGVDDHGQIVDFTSRPIDPIFKDAREDLARSRDFQKRPHPTNTTPTPASATATAIIGTNITISSPNRHQYGESPRAEPMEIGTMSAPIGINRSPGGSTPKAESEEMINVDGGPEDDSEDDSVGGKRLRIATDED